MIGYEAWLYKAKNDLKSAFRYPDIYLEPDYDEVYEAIGMAREILGFVERKIEG